MAIILKSLLLFSILPVCSLVAKDLGTWGHTYAIEEQDFLDYLRSKILAISQNEMMSKLQQFKDQIVDVANEPAAVKGLREASQYRCYYFDPTMTLADDVRDAEGKVIIKKGTTFNPLEKFSLEGELLFFDGSNAKHLAWAKVQERGHWILVKGRPLELEETEACPVYFDQGGLLSKRLRFQHIPVRVSQQGLNLKIEEIPVGGSDA